MKKQELPKWFSAKLYEEGGTVQNIFSGEEAELIATELSIYDFVMGSTIMIEMGMSNPKLVDEMKMGLEWFRENNNEAYLALFE
jgi:hypothetical protein